MGWDGAYTQAEGNRTPSCPIYPCRDNWAIHYSLFSQQVGYLRTSLLFIMRSLKSNPLSQTATRILKSQYVRKLFAKYDPPMMYSHTDDLKRAFIFGKNQFVGALTTNNIDSANFARTVVKQADFQYLILGNFNNYQLSVIANTRPSLVVSPADLFCKKELSTYLSHVQCNLDHPGVYNLEDRIFYQMDERYRLVWTNDYMTAGLYSLSNEEMKVLFGSPSSIVTLEDLMLRFQLRQLQDMYYEVLEYLKTTYKDEVSYSLRLLSTCITEAAAEKFKNSLHTKSMLYTASVLRNCAKMGKSNLLLCNRHFVNEVRHFVQKSNLNAESIYRGYLKDKSHPDYQLYRKTLKQSSRSQILKKFYLVSQLVDNSCLQLMEVGYNVFRQSIFGRMIPRSSAHSLLDEIYKHGELYKKSFLSLQSQFIANNLIFSEPEPTKRISLSEQLKLLEDRKPDFPVEYQVHSAEVDQVQHYQMLRLQQMMEEYLKSEHRLRDLQLLIEFKKKEYSQENVALYTKLLGELKIRTGSQAKLPLHHFKNFSGYYKEVMKDLILEQKYGIKRASLPQQPLNIQVRHDVSLEQIQKLIGNRVSDFGKQSVYEELDYKTAMKRWQGDDDDLSEESRK